MLVCVVLLHLIRFCAEVEFDEKEEGEVEDEEGIK